MGKQHNTRGYALLGMLIAVVCMVVLFAILMSSMNTAITGQGSALPGTVRSFVDKEYLRILHQSMYVAAESADGKYLTPSSMTPGRDRRLDTTANFFSALIAQRYTVPNQLISGNEYSPFVYADEDYDFTAYNPRDGEYWDPSFKADLLVDSNVSFAHMPFYGRRYERNWRFNVDSNVVLLGNRGPKDGIDDPTSETYGRNAQWGGHVVFGDGHVDFFDTFTPGSLYFESGGQHYADNIFAFDDGLDGADAVLTFTQIMNNDGPVVQYD